MKLNFNFILKIQIAIFMLYGMFLQHILKDCSWILFGTVFVGIIVLILDVSVNKFNFLKIISIELFLLGIFPIASMIVAILDTNYLEATVKSIIRYYEFYLMLLFSCYIAYKDKDTAFVWKMFLLIAMLSGLYIIITGGVNSGSRVIKRLVVGEGQNSNQLGIICLYGLIGIFYIKSNFFRLSSIITLAYTIMNSGSKKAFLGMIIMLILNFKNFNDAKNFKNYKKVLIAISFMLAFIASIYLLGNEENIMNTIPVIQRLAVATDNSNSTNTRIFMYKEALEFFKDSPFLGVGYDQFRNLSITGAYSHSTYAEILSCTGLFGFIIYFSSIFIILLKLLKLYIKDRKNRDLKILISVMIVLFLLAVTIILPYDLESNIIIGAIIGYVRRREFDIKKVGKK